MGGQSSKSRSVVATSINASIDAVMNSTASGALSLACTNTQIVKDAENCDIEFADQICKAVGISNFTGAQAQTANVSQDVMNEIIAGASAATEGMTIGFNSSSSSSFVNNAVDMSMDVAQTFMTDCTKSVQAVNNQSVEGCSSGSVIRFKPQDISAEVIGDCVVNQVADLAAAQKLTNAITATSDATTSGIDFFTLIIAGMICLTLFFLGMPIAAKTLTTAVLGDGPEGAANRTRVMATGFAGMFLLLCGLFWWPGLPGASGASVYGVWPHEPQWLSENSNTCFRGKNIDASTFINEYVWYDPFCLSKLAGGDGTITSCSDNDKVKHYKGCGLFATSPGCDDPQFTQDKAGYIEILEACGAPILRGRPDVMKGVCDARHLSTMFSDVSDAFEGCSRCLEGDLRGMWVGEGQACSANSVSMYDYARYAADDDSNERCDPGDPNCKETTDILARTSPGDCMNLAYQRKKKAFSQAMKACDRIDAAAKINTGTNGGVRPNMANQCPANIFDYMTKCNESTKRCSYTARSSDPLVAGSCANDFSVCCKTNEAGERVCNDPDYAKDLDMYDIANAKCAAKWEVMDGFYYVPYLTGLVYAVIGAVVLYTWVRAPAGTVSQITGSIVGGGGTSVVAAEPSIFQSTLFRVAMLVALLGLAFAAGFPFGILAIVYAGWPVSMYTEDYRTPGDRWESIAWVVVGWGLLALSVVGMLYVAYLLFKGNNVVVTTTKKKK